MEEEQMETESMGFHNDMTTTVFIRKFRFLVKSKISPNLERWFSKFHHNYMENRLYVSILDAVEDGEAATYDWLNAMKSQNDDLTLVLLDGCGNVLRSTKFNNCYIASHNEEFDYSSSDVATHELILSYESVVSDKY